MFSGVSIVCFAASYAVSLALEVSRLFFRVRLRLVVLISFALAGLAAHTIYLLVEARGGALGGAPLSSWYHWCLMVAWVVAAVYVGSTLARPRTAVGLFFLPLILGLILLALLVPRREVFTTDQVYRLWSLIHGAALLLGTVSAVIGLAAGVMFLVQAYRLKHKLPPRPGFRLPSLEWLQQANERSLIVSSCLLAAGVISGILLNLVIHRGPSHAVPWTDPVVWTSGVLFLWLLAATTFSVVYRPARRGHKVAYLTVVNFIFLGMVLGTVLLVPSHHGGWKPPPATGVAGVGAGGGP